MRALAKSGGRRGEEDKTHRCSLATISQRTSCRVRSRVPMFMTSSAFVILAQVTPMEGGRASGKSPKGDEVPVVARELALGAREPTRLDALRRALGRPPRPPGAKWPLCDAGCAWLGVDSLLRAGGAAGGGERTGRALGAAWAERGDKGGDTWAGEATKGTVLVSRAWRARGAGRGDEAVRLPSARGVDAADAS